VGASDSVPNEPSRRCILHVLRGNHMGVMSTAGAERRLRPARVLVVRALLLLQPDMPEPQAINAARRH